MESCSSNNFDSESTFSYSLNSDRIKNFTNFQFMDFIKNLKQNHENLILGNFYTDLIIKKFSNL